MTTVLFVDDEPAILNGFERNLRREPYVIITATSPTMAFAILAKQSVDVVVSDERMPGGISGSDFLARLRHAYPDVMRIMLTGAASLSESMRAIKDGVLYRFLSKPVDPDELASTIRNALRMKQVVGRVGT